MKIELAITCGLCNITGTYAVLLHNVLLHKVGVVTWTAVKCWGINETEVAEVDALSRLLRYATSIFEFLICVCLLYAVAANSDAA